MNDDRSELIARLFTLLTMAFEDGAALAVEGQGRDIDRARRRQLADQLHALGQQIMVLSDAVQALAEAGSSSRDEQ